MRTDSNNESINEAENTKELKQIDPIELQRYYTCVRNPSFVWQFIASYRRRLVIFFQDTSQVFLMAGPLLFVLIEMLFITVILNAILRLSKTDESQNSYIRRAVLNVAFPVFVQVAMIFNSSLFCVATITERENEIRNLLNFQGNGSIAYNLGMILADNLLLLIPNTLLIIFGLIFQLDVITNQAWQFYLTLTVFGFAFVPLCVLFGQPWKKLESGFKYTLIGVLLYYLAGFIVLGVT